MSEYALILANGVRLDDCQAGFADGNLWCWLHGCTFGKAYELFSVPENIAEITFVYGHLKAVFRGADTIKAIMTNRDGIQVMVTGADMTMEKDIPKGEEETS